MDAKCTPDRDECLRAALSLLAQRAYTFDGLACELGIDPEGLRSHWRSIEGLRRCQGRFLIPTVPGPCSTGLSAGPGTFLPGGSAACSRSSSATNPLDVYKRQVPGQQPQRLPAPNAQDRPGRRRVGPVSYTHLDVYKRQASSRRMLHGGAVRGGARQSA